MVLEVAEHCQKLDMEMLLALRTSLQMLGVTLDGPADLVCDNNSVVQSSVIPASGGPQEEEQCHKLSQGPRHNCSRGDAHI